MPGPDYVSNSSTSALELAARTVQRRWRKRRHEKIQKQINNLDLSTLSLENLRTHEAHLSAGPMFVSQCQLAGCTIESKAAFFMTEWEKKIFLFVTDNLSIQNTIKEEYCHESYHPGDDLNSLAEGVRQVKYAPRHPNASFSQASDGDTYWTVGIATHPAPPAFRHSDTKTWSVSLQALKTQDPHILDSLWVSPSYSDTQHASMSDPVLLDGTRFHLQCHDRDKSITYHIARPDGSAFSWAISTNQLVFAGKHVIPGLAYHLILLLRMVGGSYPQHLTEVIESDVPLNEKQQILSQAMTALMPGWMTIEAKIPVKFNRNKPYVRLCQPGIALADQLNELAHSYIRNGELNQLNAMMMPDTAMINPVDDRIKHLLNTCHQNKHGVYSLLKAAVCSDKDDPGALILLMEYEVKLYPEPCVYINKAIMNNNYAIAMCLTHYVDSFEHVSSEKNPLWCLLFHWSGLDKHDESYARQSNDRNDLLELLLDKKCPVNIRSMGGYQRPDAWKELGITPLDLAIGSDNVVAVSSLIAQGADVGFTHWSGYFNRGPFCIDYHGYLQTRSTCVRIDFSAVMRGILAEYIIDVQYEPLFSPEALGQYFTAHQGTSRSVAVIVTGQLANGKPAVLLGKPHFCRTFQFPEGPVLPNESMIDAGLRILTQTTCLDLNALIQTGAVRADVLATLPMDAYSPASYESREIGFIHVNAGSWMNALYPYPQNDLGVARIISIEDLRQLGQTISFAVDSPLKASASQLLESVICQRILDKKTLAILLSLEYLVGDELLFHDLINIDTKFKPAEPYSPYYEKMLDALLHDPDALSALGLYDIDFALAAVLLYPAMLQEKSFASRLLSLATSADMKADILAIINGRDTPVECLKKYMSNLSRDFPLEIRGCNKIKKIRYRDMQPRLHDASLSTCSLPVIRENPALFFVSPVAEASPSRVLHPANAMCPDLLGCRLI
ncbi:hypothetical protein [Legionella sp. CNM-4043-24]|uniref:hypothetical protein n=1 Tax=Legionella sp. CNM-4043-24 TaxID=3421646 RepID=UPI00403AD6DC